MGIWWNFKLFLLSWLEKILKNELSAVGKMYYVCALLKNAHSCYTDLWLQTFWYWTFNTGTVFHIATFYETNLVVENIFVQPREHSCLECFYMIVNSMLPLCRNQPIDLQLKSMGSCLYNGNTDLKLVKELKDLWNL